VETLDSILARARSLSLADRLRLAEALFEEAKTRTKSDEDDVGMRGLASWTESTRNEDWSQFYSDTLRQRRVG